MGMTAFLQRLECDFLTHIEVPTLPTLETATSDEVADWVKQHFGVWFIENRDRALAEEWVRRGWARVEYCLHAQGHYESSFRVMPDYVQIVDDWLEDKID